ncbi:hypothetical protein GCM10011351_07420 [Paraliobacillus quinghaiensis]|uniref:Uncharacterized protein n=1 Tax=Paraliobacillus quinghaiensis TaxID=470815 RepID=A0A917TJ05_9BACI|nr:hypothetical protein [Paraliobacillus quinghaiensis]GGM24186.1 hypothetical protein GCM10011351_07420 [Paraliobacillus quinghaiensis]
MLVELSLLKADPLLAIILIGGSIYIIILLMYLSFQMLRLLFKR